MASAAELFEKELVAGRPPIDVWFDGLPEKDREEFLRRAADPAVSHQAFLRVVKALGGAFSKDTVSAWRRGHGFGG